MGQGMLGHSSRMGHEHKHTFTCALIEVKHVTHTTHTLPGPQVQVHERELSGPRASFLINFCHTLQVLAWLGILSGAFQSRLCMTQWSWVGKPGTQRWAMPSAVFPLGRRVEDEGHGERRVCCWVRHPSRTSGLEGENSVHPPTPHSGLAVVSNPSSPLSSCETRQSLSTSELHFPHL
jgi:hypothetical protein